MGGKTQKREKAPTGERIMQDSKDLETILIEELMGSF